MDTVLFLTLKYKEIEACNVLVIQGAAVLAETRRTRSVPFEVGM